MTKPLVRPLETMRRVNELISESLVVGGREEPVPSLSPARYTEETSDPQWLAVAAEHEPVAVSAGEMPFALHGEGWR